MTFQYPIMYDNAKPQFNCVQRGHQNALESYPFYLLFLVLGGVKHPIISASCGAAWIISRIMYASGYASGGKFFFLFGSHQNAV